MRALFPVIFLTLFITLFGLLEVLLLRLLHRDWWQKKLIRRFAWGLPATGAVMVVLWGLAVYNSITWLILPAAGLAALTAVMEIALMLSLPISGAISLTSRAIDYCIKKHRNGEPERKVDQKRRLILKGVAAAIPAMSIAMAVTGVGRAFHPATVSQRSLSMANLPDDLDGLKILHLSDLHLGQYVRLADLRCVLEEAAKLSPDLVLITGDIADDLNQLPEALKMIGDLNAPLGAYASMGNHEYFRGPDQVWDICAASPVLLFINQGTAKTVGNSRLFIGGVDDPRRMGESHDQFFAENVGQTFKQAAEGDFKILMSHRPDAFDDASSKGVNLTLSGHTHGGQIGFMGRSAFERLSPESYLWGEYSNNNCYLYTTSGMGHWFPFRLGCPPEAPIIELKRA